MSIFPKYYQMACGQIRRVYFIDVLNDFKQINNSDGHLTEDERVKMATNFTEEDAAAWICDTWSSREVLEYSDFVSVNEEARERALYNLRVSRTCPAIELEVDVTP